MRRPECQGRAQPWSRVTRSALACRPSRPILGKPGGEERGSTGAAPSVDPSGQRCRRRLVARARPGHGPGEIQPARRAAVIMAIRYRAWSASWSAPQLVSHVRPVAARYPSSPFVDVRGTQTRMDVQTQRRAILRSEIVRKPSRLVRRARANRSTAGSRRAGARSELGCRCAVVGRAAAVAAAVGLVGPAGCAQSGPKVVLLENSDTGATSERLIPTGRWTSPRPWTVPCTAGPPELSTHQDRRLPRTGFGDRLGSTSSATRRGIVAA